MSGMLISSCRLAALAKTPAGGQAAAVKEPGVLPAASELPQDAMASLYALLTKDRENGMRKAGSDLKFAQKLRRDTLVRQKAAMQKAARARRKGRFWKKLAKTCTKAAKAAAVVSSIALAVGSAGAATPIAALAIAGAAMSTGSFVQGETQFLQKMGMSSEWASRFETGMTIGGLGCSAGAVVTGAVMADAAMTTAEEAVGQAGRIAGAVGGVGAAAGGAARIQTGRYEAETEEAYADALEAKLDDAALARQVDAMLDALEASEESDERVATTLRKTIELKSATWVAASGRA